MMMMQDGPYLNAPEKPLRIMGDAMRTQRGKDLVQDLLIEKELEVSGQKGNRILLKVQFLALECYLLICPVCIG